MQDYKKEFKDFTSEYIQSIAQERGWRYTKISLSEPNDSLYNNPKTSSKEIYKLSFNVDGYECEYYTSEYWPLDYSAQLGETLDSYKERGKDPNEQLRQAQVFSVALPFEVEPLYIASRTNMTLGNILGLSNVSFKDSTKVALEGDFKNFFDVYTPKNTALNAFTILAPNTMIRILKDAGNFDIEFSGNKVFFYQTLGVFAPYKILLKKQTYDGLLNFGVESAKNFVRAGRPASTQKSEVHMWQLYGMKTTRWILALVAVFGITFVIFVSFVFPPLWPIFILFCVIFFIRYRILKIKRRKLIEKWNPTKTSVTAT